MTSGSRMLAWGAISSKNHDGKAIYFKNSSFSLNKGKVKVRKERPEGEVLEAWVRRGECLLGVKFKSLTCAGLDTCRPWLKIF